MSDPEVLLLDRDCVRELLRQHGAEMALVLEAQLLPLVQVGLALGLGLGFGLVANPNPEPQP